MKEIKLTKNQITIVDDEDYEKFGSMKWCSSNKRGKWYVTSKRGYLARIILNAPKGSFVDHIDGNPLNNQRSNLRLSTNQENLRNRGKTKKNTSGFKGVSWDKITKNWRAQIKFDYRIHFLGRFKTKEQAHEAYVNACYNLHGKYANPN